MQKQDASMFSSLYTVDGTYLSKGYPQLVVTVEHNKVDALVLTLETVRSAQPKRLGYICLTNG